MVTAELSLESVTSCYIYLRMKEVCTHRGIILPEWKGNHYIMLF